LNNNINLPGFEGLTIKKTSEVDGTYQIHIEMEREPHTCPDCESIRISCENVPVSAIINSVMRDFKIIK